MNHQSPFRLIVAEVVTMVPQMAEVFPDLPVRMGRIEGEVGGKRYVAMVPPSMIGDDLMCESYLRHLASLDSR